MQGFFFTRHRRALCSSHGLGACFTVIRSHHCQQRALSAQASGVQTWATAAPAAVGGAVKRAL
eukprot:5375603-Pleurochrysis_carterae.AAC.1